MTRPLTRCQCGFYFYSYGQEVCPPCRTVKQLPGINERECKTVAELKESQRLRDLRRTKLRKLRQREERMVMA